MTSLFIKYSEILDPHLLKFLISDFVCKKIAALFFCSWHFLFLSSVISLLSPLSCFLALYFCKLHLKIFASCIKKFTFVLFCSFYQNSRFFFYLFLVTWPNYLLMFQALIATTFNLAKLISSFIYSFSYLLVERFLAPKS